MTLTLTDSTALSFAAQILSNVQERAQALARAAAAQHAINNNPVSPPELRGSTINFPMQDAEVLADAVLKAAKLCAEKVIEF